MVIKENGESGDLAASEAHTGDEASEEKEALAEKQETEARPGPVVQPALAPLVPLAPPAPRARRVQQEPQV